MPAEEMERKAEKQEALRIMKKSRAQQTPGTMVMDRSLAFMYCELLYVQACLTFLFISAISTNFAHGRSQQIKY